jgi:hypothetical protein
MLGILGIIALLTVLGLSLVITRLASIALEMTGLSREVATLQARSAFTGTGFTTSESEKVVNHPVRRRIVMMLMILRSAGLVTVIISVILSFVSAGDAQHRLFRLVWLIGGVAGLLALAHLPFVNRGLERVIGWALNRWTDLDVRDYSRLLNLSGDYGVTEVNIREGDWVEDKDLKECDLGQEGVTVLGIQRSDGGYVGAPHGDTTVYAGDTLIVYGRSDTLEDLDQRRRGGAGDVAHQQAVGEQKQEMARQEAEERTHEKRRRRSQKRADSDQTDESEAAQEAQSQRQSSRE